MMFFSGTCSATWLARLRSGTKRMFSFGSVRTTFEAFAGGTVMSDHAFAAGAGGEGEDVLVRRRAHDFRGVRGGDDDVGQRLHGGRGVDVADHGQVGIL